MKILFVSHNATLTGAPKVIFQIAKRFSVDHDVSLVTKDDGPLYQELLNDPSSNIQGYNVSTAYGPYNFSFEEKVEMARLFLSRELPDLVYANSVETAEWVIASRMLGIRNIFHLHEMKDALQSALRTACVSLDVMDYVDFLINVSDDVARDALDFFSTQPQKSVVLENFFECDEIIERSQQIQPLPQNSLGQLIDTNKPIVCGCGSANPRKGVDIFFEVAQQIPEIQFLWIGRWKNQEANPVDSLFIEEKLPNFFITDEVTNPYFYLNLGQMMILTSREDPNPLVVFEALILGKQVVCFTETGGSRFVVDKWGYTLSGSPSCEAIVSFLRKLQQDNTIHKPKWLPNVVQSVRNEYDIESMFSRFQNIVEDRSEIDDVEKVEASASSEKRNSVSSDIVELLDSKVGFVIEGIEEINHSNDLIDAYFLDFPKIGQFYLNGNVNLAGWITGQEADPNYMDVLLDDELVHRIPITVHRKKIGRKVGFNDYIKIPHFKGHKKLKLHAIFSDESSIEFANIQLKEYEFGAIPHADLGPDFIIGGAMKAATTAIYDYLAQHPKVVDRHPKEVHFFSEAFSQGLDWYQSLFTLFDGENLVKNKFMGEASPGYLPSVKAPIRIKALFPHVKLIFSLRDPVERAISQYYHSCAWKLGETRSIEEAFSTNSIEKAKAEISQMESSGSVPVQQGSADTTWYLYNGHYHTFINRWMRCFPKDQILILDYHQLSKDPNYLSSKLLPFLQLSKNSGMKEKKVFSNDYSTIPEEVLSNLKNYYRSHNEKLKALTGISFA